MEQEYIELEGCHENNLRNLSLKIPKRKLTIFTGVSGSGKSSIVFETVGREAQRQLNENFSAFVRTFLPKFPEVKAERVANLSAPVVIDQKPLGGNSRSTLGTISDINPLLRVLFSRYGKPHIGPASYFSFNDVHGMCPECDGIGRKLTVDLDKVVDWDKSLNQGAIILPGYKIGSWQWKFYADSGYFDKDKLLKDYSEDEKNLLLHAEPHKIKIPDFGTTNITYEGLLVRVNRLMIKKEGETSTSAEKRAASILIEGVCPKCHGKRYNDKVLGVKVLGLDISEMLSMQLDRLQELILTIGDIEMKPVVDGLEEKLGNIIDIGLGYLTLDRETATLSGGESQRIKMVKYLNSNLVDMLYIFDEPSIGLHPRDVNRLNNLLLKLRDKGNTVIVVEHDPDVIKVADHIVDMGPKAGRDGGLVMFEGTYGGLLESDTLTGKALGESLPLKKGVRVPTSFLTVKNATKHNLKNVTVDIPENVLTVVTGVAGSGKSSLIKYEFMKQHPTAVLMDQSPVGGNSRSSLATYGGVMDNIRKVFAKENDVSASLFSYNSEGACENCKGTGVVETELAFMENIKSVCDVCGGNRFKEEVLQYKYNGKTILEVLELTVAEAVLFFKVKSIKSKLETIHEMGLGYLSLGQTLDTLSGGESQRLKLANELHKESSIYVLDEPTTGLHLSDISNFMRIIDGIVENGNTVVIIEHNVEVMKRADWIVDMGPEGGTGGGQLVFSGTPSALLECEASITAKYMK